MIAALVLWAAPVHAQLPPVCKERGGALENLLDKYKEATVAMGLASNGSIVEVLASPNGETWSIIVTHPSGLSCFLATGEFWETVENLKGEAS